ncbi:MAG: TIR domain-containing protein [Pseudolysinimonas sp.]
MDVAAQSDYERYARELQTLRKQAADQSSTVARERKDEASANASAQRPSTSDSSRRMYASNAQRHNGKANDAERKRADLESKAAAKERQMYEARAKADKERDQRDQATNRERDRRQESALRELERTMSVRYVQNLYEATNVVTGSKTTSSVAFDLFISHASEDKDAIARPLYEALTARGLSVWFDEAVLTVGDSLRQKIDEGLLRSTFGVVILSHNFFSKHWPQEELNGLAAKQASSGQKVILPIWHNISKDEVAAYSPTLADKLALLTSLQGVDEIAEQLQGAIEPR